MEKWSNKQNYFKVTAIDESKAECSSNQ